MRLLRLFLLSVICAISLPSFGQLTIGVIDPGPYTPGSTIAATFAINPATCIAQGNVFSLRLSDASGNFTPGIVIGSYNSFYSTFVNGKIPLGTAPSVSYKLRVESSSGLMSVSNPFVIIAGTDVEAKLSSVTLNPSFPEAFGLCEGRNNYTYSISNESTSGASVTATVTNELTAAPESPLVFTIPNQTFTAQIAHYTLVVKAVLGGTVATKAYFIINNQTKTTFSTNGNNIVCLPSGSLEFNVSYSGPNGIQNNFPGDTYSISWGDGGNSVFTLCEIIQNGGKVSHPYILSSCGNVFSGSSGTEYNVFAVNVKVESPFCGRVGATISTTATVIAKPINKFLIAPSACTNVPIIFTNTSIVGQDPNTSSPGCAPNTTVYNWFIDGVLTFANRPLTFNPSYAFLNKGSHTITLQSVSSGTCEGDPFSITICVQDPPKPSFTLSKPTICIGGTVIPVNTSIIDNTCSNTSSFYWTVSPSIGFTYGGGTNSASPEPQFIFNNPGVYKLTLTAKTASCGEFPTVAQTIAVNDVPTATLSPDAALCSINTYDFNPTTSGPTKTIFTGTSLTVADTYTWTVTGGNSVFTSGSTPNTQYPSIQFLEYKTYTVSVTHKNNCGTITKSQVISFTPAPIVNAGSDQIICFNEVVNLDAAITGTTLTQTWVGGTGTFNTNRNDLNAKYTPSAAEKLAGQVTLTLRATTSLPTPCNVINDDVIITIKPEVTLTSANAASICTSTNFSYTPTSATAGTTFAWTATGTANAGGFTPAGNGNISDILTNSDPTLNAIITYLITPTGNGCSGVPFTLTVTVTPKAIITATATNLIICSGQSTAISLASNLPNTKYTYTSTNSAGIIGNTSNAIPSLSNTINDVLFNNTNNPGTVDYIITPISQNSCPGAPITITMTVQPQPTASNAGVDESICNETTYNLKGNAPIVGTGLWTQVTAFAGVTFTNANQNNGTANGLIPGNIYIFRWTITGLSGCSPNYDDVSITVNPTTVGGNATGSATVCGGNNTGQINLSGETGTVIRWESSTDGGITYPNTINNTNTSLTYTNLSTTTYFRAIVQSGSCAVAMSTPAIITVNQSVTVANASLDQELCNGTSTTLAGNSPMGTNTALWTLTSGQPGVTFVDATQPNTVVNGLVGGQTYTFLWTISGLAPCKPTKDEVIVKVNLPSNGGTTAGNASVCAGNSNAQITLSGQVGTIVRWESSTDNFATKTNINTTQTFITYTNLATTTQFRAIVKNGNCADAISTVSTITVNQGAIGAIAGPDQILCNANSTILAGNDPLTNRGLWTLTSGQIGVTIVDPTKYNTAVNGLVGGQNYTFNWKISGLSPCPETNSQLLITNLASMQNNAISTPATTICNGQVITISGTIPTGGNGNYTYVWETSLTGSTPWTVIAGQIAKDLNVTVTTNLSYRRTVNGGACAVTSNIIAITQLPKIANNTIGIDQIICLTTTPNTISGSQPTGGDGLNYTFSWEQSIDNGNNWSVVANASAQNYSPPAITQTTLYRRLVSSSACNGSSQSISNAITIKVNLNALAEFTYTNDTGCVPFLLDATNIKAMQYPAQNATYTWYADGVSIGTGISFPGFTISAPNATVVIKLVTTSSLGCIASEMTHSFKTRQDVIASFTQSATIGCGPLSVSFTNTTNTSPGFIYEWSVDNTIISTAIDPGTLLFLSDPAGNDKIYTVSLKVTTPCGIKVANSTVTVRPTPVAAFLPSKTIGCSPLTVIFSNTSPGSSTSYSYDFDDGTTSPSINSKADISHTFITNAVKDYTVKMTASNECGVDTKSIIIRVSPNTITPALVVNGNQMRGCAPFLVNFINNSRGASKFTYTFEPGVVVIANTVQTEVRPYTFTKAGTYVVNMVAENDCSSASAQVTIIVDPQPTASFTSSTNTGCVGLSVKFTNTSQNAASYSWDFGDGTAFSNDANPTHVFNGPPGSFNVKLTSTNSFGCTYTNPLDYFITTVSPPKAGFAISPATVISIPDYTFNFTDESTNKPQTYKWSFGDGDISSLKDPTHKYTDTGKYQVTMRTFNEFGCVDSVQKYVQIVGVPGYVYLPNSFIPGGTSSPLQKFIALGSGIKSWHMTVFNKWGQVLWETTQLDDGKPVEGWDGTYKNVAQPQGIYFWKLEVELVNGTEWKGMTLNNKAPKRTGEIYLIR